MIELKCFANNNLFISMQFHLFNCDRILENCEALANNLNVEYEDIFDIVTKQAAVPKLLCKIMESRTYFIEHG